MINQQLLEFIKGQIQQGVIKETIEKELLGNGWTRQDIEEAYKAVGDILTPAQVSIPTPIRPQSSNTILTPNANLVSNFSTFNNGINAGIGMPNISIKEKIKGSKLLIGVEIFLFVLIIVGFVLGNKWGNRSSFGDIISFASIIALIPAIIIAIIGIKDGIKGIKEKKKGGIFILIFSILLMAISFVCIFYFLGEFGLLLGFFGLFS